MNEIYGYFLKIPQITWKHILMCYTNGPFR